MNPEPIHTSFPGGCWQALSLCPSCRWGEGGRQSPLAFRFDGTQPPGGGRSLGLTGCLGEMHCWLPRPPRGKMVRTCPPESGAHWMERLPTRGGQHLLSRGTSQTRARGGGHQSALKRRGCGVSADAPRTKRRAGKKEEEGQTAGCWCRQNSVELGTGGLGHAEPGKAEATPEEETRGVESPSPSATGAGWRSCLIKPHFSLPRSTSLRIKKLSC